MDGPTDNAISHLRQATLLFPEHNGMRENYEVAIKMHTDKQARLQELTLLKSTMNDSHKDYQLSSLDVRAKEFLGVRVESFSALSSNDESKQLAFAA